MPFLILADHQFLCLGKMASVTIYPWLKSVAPLCVALGTAKLQTATTACQLIETNSTVSANVWERGLGCRCEQLCLRSHGLYVILYRHQDAGQAQLVRDRHQGVRHGVRQEEVREGWSWAPGTAIVLL